MPRKVALLRKDIKDEKEGAELYEKRQKQFPEFKSIFHGMHEDEESHRQKLEGMVKKMPIHSGKQYRFMAGIAHGMKPRKKGAGPSPEVAREMIMKTSKSKRSEFARKK